MILQSTKESESSSSADAPPAYDELVPPSSPFRVDRKRQSEAVQDSPLAGPSTSNIPALSRPGRKLPGSNTPLFGLGSWFNKHKGTQKEFKQTIQSLIRDVVNQPSSPPAVSVLQSCLEACQARGLSFESIVSEKFIEGHCPVYWAIVKRPALSSDSSDDQVHLLDVFLSLPFNSTSRSEAYLACLLSSDQGLFQRLRHMPGSDLPSLSAADKLLIGEAPEDILVENLEGDHGEFRVKWNIAQFQKRMRVLGGIGTEVIARGRIWFLAFAALSHDITSGGIDMKAGSWVVSVSLLDPSSPTHVDAQFLISGPVIPLFSSQPSVVSSSSSSPNLPAQPQPPRRNPLTRWRSSLKNSRKPPITLHMSTKETQLEPLPLLSTRQDLQKHVLTEPGVKTLIAPLNSHANGDSLQFDGCNYLNSDGSLSVAFDARLAKPGTGGDCVIC